MKLATTKLITFFVCLTILSNISAKKMKLPDGTAFGYASNENILQNSSVKP